MPSMYDANYVPVAGRQALTVSSTALALTIPLGATHCLMQATTANVRWNDETTTPTATVGQQLAAGDSWFYNGALADVKVVRETSDDAVLQVNYYKVG